MSGLRLVARGARRLLRMAGWALLGAVATVVLAVTAPRLAGWQTLTVMSGSMTPTISTGDVVVVQPMRPDQIKLGDVVTFRDPGEPQRLLTHRVRGITLAQGKVRLVTRGDANTGVERWDVAIDGTVGLVEYRLPRMGYVLAALRGPIGRVGLVTVPILAWGILELRALWRSRPKQPSRAKPQDQAALA